MWNAGPGGADTEREGADDVAFLRALIADVREKAGLDPRRIFFTGFSNGAAMCFRFAVAEPDLVAAIAPVAGHFRFPVTALPRAIPMTYFFGRQDPLSPYEGGPVDLPWGAREVRPARPRLRARMVPPVRIGRGANRIEPGDGFTVERFGPDVTGAEILFTTIDDCGHTWPGGHRLLPEAMRAAPPPASTPTAEIWNFFQRHPLP
jgi:polyhydroxybutyrate depolymerase